MLPSSGQPVVACSWDASHLKDYALESPLVLCKGGGGRGGSLKFVNHFAGHCCCLQPEHCRRLLVSELQEGEHFTAMLGSLKLASSSALQAAT